MTPHTIEAGGASDPGQVREHNEDHYVVTRLGDLTVLAVADGIGGHRAGEVASALAISTFTAALKERPAPRIPLDRRVRQAADRAHQVLLACATGDQAGMATTLTAVVSDGRHAVVAHVGDSRLYRWRPGRPTARSAAETAPGWEQVTVDHSLAQALAAAGEPVPDADDPDRRSAGDGMRHVLTRALGAGETAGVDVEPVTLTPGDRLLLCTDGLSGLLPDDALAGVVGESPSPAAAAQRLVELANGRGAPDNVTAVVAQVRSPRRTALPVAAALAAVVVLLVGGTLWARSALDRSAFLGVADERVAVFRGLPLKVLRIPLYRLERTTAVRVSDVVPAFHPRLRQGILLDSPEDADRVLRDLVNPEGRPLPGLAVP